MGDTRLILVELSVVEQRYQAVLAVIRDGVPVVEVARRLLHELTRAGVQPLPSRSGVYRFLRRQRDKTSNLWTERHPPELRGSGDQETRTESH